MLLFTPPALALILSLPACGSDKAETGSSTATSPGTASSGQPTTSPTKVQPGKGSSDGPEDKLTIQVKASAKAAPKKVTLTCDPAGGSHPDASAACQALANAKTPFKAPPKQQICTKIYGGPQVATVQGTWQGKPVQAKFTRADGCEIHRWQQMGPVFAKLAPA